jgi:hypothetical protein
VRLARLQDDLGVRETRGEPRGDLPRLGTGDPLDALGPGPARRTALSLLAGVLPLHGEPPDRLDVEPPHAVRLHHGGPEALMDAARTGTPRQVLHRPIEGPPPCTREL